MLHEQRLLPGDVCVSICIKFSIEDVFLVQGGLPIDKTLTGSTGTSGRCIVAERRTVIWLIYGARSTPV